MTTSSQNHNLREQLAEFIHNILANWLRYLHDETFKTDSKTDTKALFVSSSLESQLSRQIKLDYSDLSEDEKELNRIEADKILAMVGESKPTCDDCGIETGIRTGIEKDKCFIPLCPNCQTKRLIAFQKED